MNRRAPLLLAALLFALGTAGFGYTLARTPDPAARDSSTTLTFDPIPVTPSPFTQPVTVLDVPAAPSALGVAPAAAIAPDAPVVVPAAEIAASAAGQPGEAAAPTPNLTPIRIGQVTTEGN